MADLLYGRNAIREALRAGRRSFERLLVSSGAQQVGTLAEIMKLAEGRSVPISYVDRRELDKHMRDTNHQGVGLQCGGYPYSELDDMLALAETRGQPVLLLMLDHLQDPQNVGTLLRTAEVVGAHGVVIPGRRAVEITPAVVNASSGATEHLLISNVANIAQAIEAVQKVGVWVAGVEDDERASPIDRVDMNMPLALVLGSEGPGLARLTRERCDFLVRLPMAGEIASLNVAVAGSIALYIAWRARSPAEPA
jgi:23S rRNA (guanosine2251-2'-O)-methyltransferase